METDKLIGNIIRLNVSKRHVQLLRVFGVIQDSAVTP